MSFSQRTTPTLRDVAALAGVSPMTASYALRGTRRVGEAAAARVHAAARRLNYVPDPAAALLAARRTGVPAPGARPHLACIDAGSARRRDPIAEAVVAAGRARGYVVSRFGWPEPGAAGAFARCLAARGVAGLILIDPAPGAPMPAPDLPALELVPAPGRPSAAGRDRVTLDHAGMLAQALTHARSAGRKRPALVAAPETKPSRHLPADLLAGLAVYEGSPEGFEAWRAQVGADALLAWDETALDTLLHPAALRVPAPALYCLAPLAPAALTPGLAGFWTSPQAFACAALDVLVPRLGHRPAPDGFVSRQLALLPAWRDY